MDLLAQSFFASAYKYSEAFDLRTFLGNLFMLQDFPWQVRIAEYFRNIFSGSLSWFQPITSFGSARPLWTVAIEWWIYLLFGWMVLGDNQRKRSPLRYWLILVLLLPVPLFNWFNGFGNGLAIVWVMGLFIYILLSRLRLSLLNWQLCLLAAIFLLAGFFRLYYKSGDAYDVLYAGQLGLALYFALCFLQQYRFANSKTVSFLVNFNASFAYTLYLVHYTLLAILVLWLGPGISNMLIGFAVSNVVAIVMSLVFERNYKKFGRWLKQRFSIVES